MNERIVPVMNFCQPDVLELKSHFFEYLSIPLISSSIVLVFLKKRTNPLTTQTR